MQKNIKFIQNLSAQLGKRLQKQSISCTCHQFIRRNANIPNQSISLYRQNTLFLATRNFHQTKYLQNANQQPEDVVPNKEQQPPKKKAGQLAKVFAEYGTTAVVFHTTISLTSLGICYTAVSSGVDVVGLLQKLNLIGEATAESKLASGAGTFVVAYACHKVFMPLRAFLTVSCTPILVKRLRKMGFLKTKKSVDKDTSTS